jgi:hypothetical protein
VIEDEIHNDEEEPIEFFMNKEITPPSDDEPQEITPPINVQKVKAKRGRKPRSPAKTIQDRDNDMWHWSETAVG